MKRAIYPLLAIVVCSAGAAAARENVPAPKPRPVKSTPAQTAAPGGPSGKTGDDGVVDMSHAVPLSDAVKMPSPQDQYQSLKTQIERTRPIVQDAHQTSDRLKSEAEKLRARLITTVQRVQFLEQQKVDLALQVSRLAREEKILAADFDRDRVAVGQLLAVLQRLQHDMPPVIALKTDDALGAARGAMLLGASLPRIYGAAAALARRIETLKATRVALARRRAEAIENSRNLGGAVHELDQLLAIRQAQASDASDKYESLQAELDQAADKAADLEVLLAKVAALRSAPAGQEMVFVGPANGSETLRPGALLRPVMGKTVAGGLEGIGGATAPGLSFFATAGSHVVAPADSQVLFAGPYHKAGQVLILEMADGYDLVLAGLGRVGVRPGDQLLAGEPVGTMPQNGQGSRLYFELRKGGKGINPAPWLEVDLRKAKRS